MIVGALVAYRTVRCAHVQEVLVTASLVGGAIYTPPPTILNVCNALNLGVEFFLLFSHQIQALLFPFSLFFSLSLDLFQSRSGFWL
jgi:hypothetical protein